MNNITKRPLDAPTTINPPTKKPKLDDFSGAGGRSYAEGALVDGPNPGLLKRQHIEDLKEKGYTVVEGVMSAQDCTNIQQAWLATMGSYEGTGFKANDRSTWKGNNLPANIRGMQNWPVQFPIFPLHFAQRFVLTRSSSSLKSYFLFLTRSPLVFQHENH